MSMTMTASTCAMCGERMAQPYGGFSVPPFCVQLLDGGEEIDPSEIAGDVSIDLCKDCTEIGRRMIREYDTSPLPECDADAASWSHAGMMAAMAGEDTTADDFTGGTQEKVADAVMTVRVHQKGKTEHVLDAKVDEAYVTVWAAQELDVWQGQIGGDAE
jgi:hypothetical protein